MTNDKKLWLGIDVAKNTFHAAVDRGDTGPHAWARLSHADFAHTSQGMQDLRRWLAEQGVKAGKLGGVCIEATGRLGTRWVELADERLGPVSIVNPAYICSFAKSLGLRDKTDRVDACVIAVYGRVMQPAPTKKPTETCRALNELGRTYQTLQQECLAWKQRLEDGPSSKIVRKLCADMMKSLECRMTRMHKEMEREIASCPTMEGDYKRLLTVNGIGRRTALVLLGEFGDLRQYNRDELVALAGLYPREYSSGTSVHKASRLAKAGKGNVRAVLYMAAMSAKQSNAHIKAFAERLKKHGKRPMQVLCAVMRKLLMIAHAVVVSAKDYDPTYPATPRSVVI